MANIGKNIKQMRIKNNMTQEDLAEALFVTRQTISNYEMGKSNPDIDTIIKIAELFKVDANTVIYGLPLEEKQKRARSWAIGISIVLVILLVADFAMNSFLKQYSNFLSSPRNILKYSLFPLTYLVSGFYAMHLVGLFSSLKPFNSKTSKIIRIFVLIITCAFVAKTLYFGTFKTVSFIRLLQNGYVNMSWPGFFGDIWLMNIVAEYPFVFSILGALCWLFGLIYREK